LEEKFNKQIAINEIFLRKYSAVFSVIGYIKLAAAALLAVSGYFTFAKGFSGLFFMFDAALIFVSVLLWIYHAKIHGKVNYYEGIITINKQYLARISGEWTAFPDTGSEFADTEHPYACDLDIVGGKSLFQLLNVTNTWHGRQAFSNDLLSQNYDTGELLLRQEAIEELSGDIAFSNEMQYCASKIGVSDAVLKLIGELKNNRTFIKSKFVYYLLTILPVITVVTICGMFIFQLKYLNIAGAVLVFVQILIWILGMMKTFKFMGSIAKVSYKLEHYSFVFEMLQNRDFKSKKLIRLKEQLVTSNLSATKAIKQLDKITSRISAKNNGLLYVFLNVFLLWDYGCCFMLQAWKEKYAPLAEEWFLAFGEFESLLSFSNLPNVCSSVCIPVIVEDDKIIEAADIGHPLINNSIRVNNNLSVNNNIFIISGSNMSGKTTFLRTVGINLVLANAGSFVCAQNMTLSRFKIMTSMRVADDLNEGISTFYAELKKIKGIIDFANSNNNLIFLIDEIFKGTNSVDRFYGAKTVISKLDRLGVMGFITTHDLELCDLENQHIRIKNFSFSEHYENNQILFDYKITAGKSNTTNAKYLMEMIGIL